MKVRFFVVAGYFLTGLAPLIIAAKKEPAKLPADVAAIVNGEKIPERLVTTFLQNDQEVAGAYPNTEEGRKKLAELRQAIISEQIERALIAQEAERRKIAPTKEQLNEAENKAILGHGGVEGYTEFLRQNHFTREDYIRYVVRSKLCGEALSREFAKTISVSDDQVNKYYQEHNAQSDFQWPERITGAHILIEGRPAVLAEQLKLEKKIPDGPELAAATEAEIKLRKERAEKIHEETIKPGADFAALARKYSDDTGTRSNGGSLGTFAKGTHVLPLDQAFFNLKAGEIGPVVETEYGFHVIKVLDRKPAGTKTLAEMTGTIRTHLARMEQVKKMQEWLGQARQRARIQISSSPSLGE